MLETVMSYPVKTTSVLVSRNLGIQFMSPQEESRMLKLRILVLIARHIYYLPDLILLQVDLEFIYEVVQNFDDILSVFYRAPSTTSRFL